MSRDNEDVYRLKADAAYFQAIEDHFRRLRGTHLFLSPRDNPMIDAWWEAGIPLEIIRRALDDVFARRREAGEERPVLSLAYCRHAVEEAFAEWKESRLGAGGGAAAPQGPGPQEAGAFLRERAAELQAAAAREPAAAAALQVAAREVLALASRLAGDGPPSLSEAEAELEAVEDRLLEEILAALDAPRRAALREAAERTLAELRPRLTERAWEGSLRNRLHALLRDHLRLPRLTLFFL